MPTSRTALVMVVYIHAYVFTLGLTIRIGYIILLRVFADSHSFSSRFWFLTFEYHEFTVTKTSIIIELHLNIT